MKISLLALAVAAALAAGALGAGRALATTTNTTPKTVKIVMRDPGCHWFVVHGKYVTKDNVKPYLTTKTRYEGSSSSQQYVKST